MAAILECHIGWYISPYLAILPLKIIFFLSAWQNYFLVLLDAYDFIQYSAMLRRELLPDESSEQQNMTWTQSLYTFINDSRWIHVNYDQLLIAEEKTLEVIQ